MTKFDIQLFGKDLPPYYSKKTVDERIKKVDSIIKKIYELVIEVEAEIDEIKKADTVKD